MVFKIPWRDLFLGAGFLNSLSSFKSAKALKLSARSEFKFVTSLFSFRFFEGGGALSLETSCELIGFSIIKGWLRFRGELVNPDG